MTRPIGLPEWNPKWGSESDPVTVGRARAFTPIGRVPGACFYSRFGQGNACFYSHERGITSGNEKGSRQVKI
jgi:hypothetical protein